jgi:thiol:disulfide interchange protein
MLRNTVRGVLGLILVAAATWLANYITEAIFGPEDPATRA